jgi:hypothetical protein
VRAWNWLLACYLWPKKAGALEIGARSEDQGAGGAVVRDARASSTVS